MTQEELHSWKTSMDQFVIHDIRVALQKDILEAGLIILTLVGIESLSGYYMGEKADRDTFISFLQTDFFPKTYHTLAEDIYRLRNKLLHDYTSTGDTVVLFRTEDQAHSHGLKHLHPIYPERQYPFCLVREKFSKDLLIAWDNFSSAVFSDKNLANNVLRRIQKTGRGFLIVTEIPKNPLEGISTDKLNQISDEGYAGGTIPYKL